MLDCTAHKNVCEKYGITGYPTVKMFRKNAEPVKYDHARTKEAMMKWIDERVPEEVEPDQNLYKK